MAPRIPDDYSRNNWNEIKSFFQSQFIEVIEDDDDFELNDPDEVFPFFPPDQNHIIPNEDGIITVIININ